MNQDTTPTLKLMSVEDINKGINQVKTSGARFDALVQRIAVECVAQSIIHRNVTPGNDLFNALPKGSRRDSLVAWFERFGHFAWMKTEKKLAFFDAKLEMTAAYFVEVRATHWTTGTKPAAIVSTYDLEKEFSKVLDRLGKIVSDSTKTIEHRDLYAKLRLTYNAYVAGHLQDVAANDTNSPEAQAA